MFGIGMLTAAGYDLAVRRVPNWLNVAVCVGGLTARAAMGGWTGLGLGLAGAALGLVLLYALFEARWIGAGDVKLFAAIGAWLGPLDVCWAGLIGLAGGGLIAAAIALTGGSQLRAEVVTNLKNAALAMATPHAPRRGKQHMVPMAVALGSAAIGVFFARGGV
jgi:prepilin peptidase CpaA